MNVSTHKNTIPIISKDVSISKFSSNKYLLKQLKYGYYLKITNDVYELLCLFDGIKNLEEIAILYNQKFKSEIDLEFIHNIFFIKLIKYGILVNTKENATYQQKPNYLKLSFIVINKKLLSKITPYFHTLFRAKTLCILTLLSLTLIITSLSIKYHLFKNTLQPESVLLFVLLMAISATLHELGHASAAEYFGAKHGGIGGGFYLLLPVYFADVTDIWMLKRKERVIVNFAGVYFDVLLCSIMLIIGFLISNDALILISFIIFFHSIYNLIPFLRNDGYWILSDLTGITNFYTKSNLQLINFIKSVFGNKKYSKNKTNNLLVIYSATNLLFLVFFILYSIIFSLKEIIYFPYDFYKYVIFSWNARSVDFDVLSDYLIPFVFYYLFFSFFKNKIIKK